MNPASEYTFVIKDFSPFFQRPAYSFASSSGLPYRKQAINLHELAVVGSIYTYIYTYIWHLIDKEKHSLTQVRTFNFLKRLTLVEENRGLAKEEHLRQKYQKERRCYSREKGE